MPLGINFDLKRAFGKTQTRSQMLLMKTPDGRCVHLEVPVLSGCAIDENLCAGFLIDTDNQYQDEKTGHWFQIIDEKCTIPLALRNKSRYKVANEDQDGMPNRKDVKTPMERLLLGIFHNSWTSDLATLDREKENKRRNQVVYAFLIIPMVLAVLYYTMNYMW